MGLGDMWRHLIESLLRGLQGLVSVLLLPALALAVIALLLQMWTFLAICVASAVAIFLIQLIRIRIPAADASDDLIRSLADRLGYKDYLDAGNVSFLPTVVCHEGGFEWEIWVQGCRKGTHILSIEASTSPSFTDRIVAGPTLRSTLQCQDDELVSFFVKQQPFEGLEGTVVDYDFTARAETKDGGKRLRFPNGVRLYVEKPTSDAARMLSAAGGRISSLIEDEESTDTVCLPIAFPERIDNGG